MLDALPKIIRPARKQSIFRTDRGGASGVGRVFGGLVVCLVVTGLLSSGRLVSMAERQEFGSRRDRWIVAAGRVDAIAGALQLDRPARAIDAALGRNDDEPVEIVLGDLTPVSTVAETTPTQSPDSTIDEQALTPDTSVAVRPAPTTTTTAAPTTTTTAPPILGEVSVNDPLRIWVGGDSLGEYIGSQLLYKVADPDLTEIEMDFAISTGLARPDYFDWPARLSEIMQRGDRPQVVVFMVGGNDDQDVMVDGRRGVIGTDDWRAAYQQRVATMMDIAAYDGVQMLWINLPPMRDESRQAIAGDINAALRSRSRGETLGRCRRHRRSVHRTGRRVRPVHRRAGRSSDPEGQSKRRCAHHQIGERVGGRSGLAVGPGSVELRLPHAADRSAVHLDDAANRNESADHDIWLLSISDCVRRSSFAPGRPPRAAPSPCWRTPGPPIEDRCRRRHRLRPARLPSHREDRSSSGW